MAKSDIEICNVALSTLGQRSIFSFDSSSFGDNALLCKNIYNHGRQFLLSRVDWPFARHQATLNKLAEPDAVLEDGYAIYSLPNLCIKPLYLLPPYHRVPWSIVVEGVMTLDAEADQYPRMVFTKNITDPSKFSDSFSELLVSYIVSKIAGPIAGLSPKEVAYYSSLFKSDLEVYSATDLNVGQGAPFKENEADLDSFNA